MEQNNNKKEQKTNKFFEISLKKTRLTSRLIFNYTTITTQTLCRVQLEDRKHR